MEAVEDDLNLAVLADVLVAQAIALNRVYARAFGDILRGKTRSLRDVGRALKAQNQCRIALKLLIALRGRGNRTTKLEAENSHHSQGRGHPSKGPSWREQPRPQEKIFDKQTDENRNFYV